MKSVEVAKQHMSQRRMPSFPIRPFTVDEYHRMIHAGILTEDDRVELLEGWIVPKMARTPSHDTVLDQTGDAIRARLPKDWRVRDQKEVTLPDSEPEPDLSVVPARASRFRDHHPGPSEIAALVEISAASLSEDRNAKGRVYARANIGCYWIVNLIDSQVEVYTDPDPIASPPVYRSRQDYFPGQDIPLTIPGAATVMIPVAEMLG